MSSPNPMATLRCLVSSSSGSRQYDSSLFRKRFLNEDGLTWDHPFIGNFEGSHEIHNISVDETDLKTISEQSEQMAASVVEVSSDRFFLEALNSVRNSAGKAEARSEDEIKRFRKRLESYWREPLELLTKQRSVAM
ncbi:MAG: hypothetical protein E6Q31_08455, partial [Aquabacterium sp.]